jgi:hypothetical protein
MDENGLQFFNLIDQNAVGCWNSLLPYAPANQAVVARHDEAMIFPADVKVSRDIRYRRLLQNILIRHGTETRTSYSFIT